MNMESPTMGGTSLQRIARAFNCIKLTFWSAVLVLLAWLLYRHEFDDED